MNSVRDQSNHISRKQGRNGERPPEASRRCEAGQVKDCNVQLPFADFALFLGIRKPHPSRATVNFLVRIWHQAGIGCNAASRPVIWVLLTQKPSRQALTSNHVLLPLRPRVIRQIAMNAVAAISRCDWVVHRNRVCRPRVLYPDRESLNYGDSALN